MVVRMSMLDEQFRGHDPPKLDANEIMNDLYPSPIQVLKERTTNEKWMDDSPKTVKDVPSGNSQLVGENRYREDSTSLSRSKDEEVRKKVQFDLRPQIHEIPHRLDSQLNEVVVESANGIAEGTPNPRLTTSLFVSALVLFLGGLLVLAYSNTLGKLHRFQNTLSNSSYNPKKSYTRIIGIVMVLASTGLIVGYIYLKTSNSDPNNNDGDASSTENQLGKIGKGNLVNKDKKSKSTDGDGDDDGDKERGMLLEKKDKLDLPKSLFDPNDNVSHHTSTTNNKSKSVDSTLLEPSESELWNTIKKTKKELGGLKGQELKAYLESQEGVMSDRSYIPKPFETFASGFKEQGIGRRDDQELFGLGAQPEMFQRRFAEKLGQKSDLKMKANTHLADAPPDWIRTPFDTTITNLGVPKPEIDQGLFDVGDWMKDENQATSFGNGDKLRQIRDEELARMAPPPPKPKIQHDLPEDWMKTIDPVSEKKRNRAARKLGENGGGEQEKLSLNTPSKPQPKLLHMDEEPQAQSIKNLFGPVSGF